MAVYPSIAQGADGKRIEDVGVQIDVADDGIVRGRTLYAGPRWRFEFEHPLVSAVERDTLLTFYRDNAALVFTFTWDDDASTYNAVFSAPMDVQRVSASAYNVRVRLIGW